MRHRIAIGGIHIESSTFSPHRSGAADFTVVRGDELLARYDDLPRHVDWLPLVHARALPGGAVERDFYASVKAWVRVPVLLPGERACTRDEPARSIYGGLPAIAACAGIIDAAVWIGYAWADEPRCSAAVVVTGTDEKAITREARSLAEEYWKARARFGFSTAAGAAEWCIAAALASRDRPFFISDSGDNPTAGGAGDVAFMLERLLSDPALATGRATAIWASVVDPA